MNVGCTWDERSLCADYDRTAIKRSWLGWGVVTDRRPELFPYEPVKKRRRG